MTAPSTSISISDTLSDEDIAQSARNDIDSFAELYQRHFLRIYRYHMLRTNSVTDAQDLTTQTFLAALEGISSYQKKGSFMAWLYGIARHKAALHFREKARYAPLEDTHDCLEPAPSPEINVGQRLDLEHVSDALDQLNPERADAIMLCVIAGLSMKEAAEVMHKNPAAVKMLVFRGLRELRGKLAHLLKED